MIVLVWIFLNTFILRILTEQYTLVTLLPALPKK